MRAARADDRQALGLGERHVFQPRCVLAGQLTGIRCRQPRLRNNSAGAVSVDLANTTKPSPGLGRRDRAPFGDRASARRLQTATTNRFSRAVLPRGEPDRAAVGWSAEKSPTEMSGVSNTVRRLPAAPIVGVEIPAIGLEAWAPLGADEDRPRRRARTPAARRPRDSASACAARRLPPARRTRRCSSSRPRDRRPRGSIRTRSRLPSGEKAIAASSCWVGGESKSPGVRSLVASALHVGHEHVVSNVLAPLVPVAIEQPGDPLRLDRVLLVGFAARLRVARFVAALRDTRPTRTRLAIRRWRQSSGGCDAHRQARQLPDIAAVGAAT